MFSRIITLRLALAAMAGGPLAAPLAAKCPPQISVERPRAASAGARDAFVLIHASRGCARGNLTVTGTAEGLVGGERRSIPLEVAATDADGVYRVPRQWPAQGVWVLRLVVQVGDGGTAAGTATALVGVNAAGEIAAIREQDPNRRRIPFITDADVESMLRSLSR